MSVILIILFLVVAGFAYLNYDRLNQIQDDLNEKEVLLEDSGQLIKQQETAIAQMEEQIKERKEKEKIPPEDNLMEDRDDEIQKQLNSYQAELQELRAKLEESLQKDRIESQNIDQLRQEKSKLEVLLGEKAEQWQSREMENKEIISTLQQEINKYKLDIKSVNEKIAGLGTYLDTEILKRKSLEQEMNNYKENIATLQEKLALEQDDEARVQEISQLQANKKQLEEEIEQKDFVLEQIQKEYQLLQSQLANYEQEMLDLQKEVLIIEEQKDILDEIKANLVQLREDKSKLEALLQEKEEQWQSREEDNREAIAYLQEEAQEYKSNIKNIENETMILKKDLIEEKLSREQLVENIAYYEEQISDLKKELEDKFIKDEKVEQELYQLEQGKAKLETLLQEREEQWQMKEEDTKQTIARLKTEVQDYESSLKEIGNEMLSLKQDITEKFTLKESLREKIEHFTAEINDLKEEVAHFQGIEKSYQNAFSQLQSNMELLEQQLEEKGLQIEQPEYNALLDQLSLYQYQMEELKKEIANAREKEDAISAKQFTEMQQEIETLEKVVVEKEDKWNRQNQENKELISSLKNQLAKYQEEIEVVKIDSALLTEEIAAQVELQQERMARIKDREEQIAALISDIERYAQKIQEYEITVNELMTRLNQQENLSLEEKQELMDKLVLLIEEREAIQSNVSNCHAQIDKLQAEIVELKDKIAVMEKEEDRQFYEVRSGDCLWTIARDRYSEGIAWTKIFKANQGLIENPDLIYPYQQIILPE